MPKKSKNVQFRQLPRLPVRVRGLPSSPGPLAPRQAKAGAGHRMAHGPARGRGTRAHTRDINRHKKDKLNEKGNRRPPYRHRYRSPASWGLCRCSASPGIHRYHFNPFHKFTRTAPHFEFLEGDGLLLERVKLPHCMHAQCSTAHGSSGTTSWSLGLMLSVAKQHM